MKYNRVGLNLTGEFVKGGQIKPKGKKEKIHVLLLVIKLNNVTFGFKCLETLLTIFHNR